MKKNIYLSTSNERSVDTGESIKVLWLIFGTKDGSGAMINLNNLANDSRELTRKELGAAIVEYFETEKVKLSKENIITIIKNNIKWSTSGSGNYEMIDSYKIIADKILEEVNRRNYV